MAFWWSLLVAQRRRNGFAHSREEEAEEKKKKISNVQTRINGGTHVNKEGVSEREGDREKEQCNAMF